VRNKFRLIKKFSRFKAHQRMRTMANLTPIYKQIPRKHDNLVQRLQFYASPLKFMKKKSISHNQFSGTHLLDAQPPPAKYYATLPTGNQSFTYVPYGSNELTAVEFTTGGDDIKMAMKSGGSQGIQRGVTTIKNLKIGRHTVMALPATTSTRRDVLGGRVG